eukprot:TRINITY_DN19990_c0_g1_i1.p1 TRINITY_DN19990_c0_g1~~TRINITY_DN19990_c0_g1_i1.p1  ORF type:complete len:332 (+),score=30.86 TRINITY_DN19990_c0_g1_i1:31-996(+)
MAAQNTQRAKPMPAFAPPPAPIERHTNWEPGSWESCYDTLDMVEVSPQSMFAVYRASNNLPPPYLVLLHGGGLSSLSWGCAVRKLKEQSPIVAIDFRGHGLTETCEQDFSKETLMADVIAVLQALFPSLPPLILAGHSLGGAIATWLAASNKLPVHGFVVVDVVEGSALESLKYMNQVLESRPSGFPSLSRAIDWSLKSGGMRNPESARLSVPAQLRETPAPNGQGSKWVWRTDLRASEQNWQSWFQGMSLAFLGAPCPKLLLLAGTDRLDRELTIAQMQGKFQLGLVYGTGHYMMEDRPEETATRILEFCRRIAAILPRR